ncbi:GTPase-activating protein BEM2/IPL2 [Candida viswanathii]|uniref:GTPase-activating protein BEM2/IPL2 n=1 Tax=Candida viswanathii TaxID=5486 RepID=A0A367YJ92_9ASCO|nr:GTPase-activating protein BEM2/IPL2 [Candida viswanathii]
MRKIWSRRDKDKRKSITHSNNGTPLIYSQQQFDSNENLPLKHNHQHHPLQHSVEDQCEYDDVSSIHGQLSFTSTTDKYSTHSSATLTNNSNTSSVPRSYISPRLGGNNQPLQQQQQQQQQEQQQKQQQQQPTISSASSLPPLTPLVVKLSSLVKPEHDSTLIKHNWVNGIINGGDVNENNLRLYRAELKGSHLYLYKPAPNLNIKSFRLEEPPTPKEVEAMMQHANNSSSSLINTAGANTSSLGSASTHTNPSNAHDNATVDTVVSTLVDPKSLDTTRISSPLVSNTPHIGPPSLNLRKNSSLDTPTLALKKDLLEPPRTSSIPNTPVTAPPSLPVTSSTDASEYKITYFQAQVPHPDLQYDFTSHTFTSPLFKDGKNTLEALLHFLFFSQDPADAHTIQTIVNTLPILPDFGLILKFASIYLSYIFEKKFEGVANIDLAVQRILGVLKNLEEHFDGYLLKSDIAPYILKILETINHHELEDITIFKNKMLHKQQLLIDLVNNDNLPLNVQPFQDLNSDVFMKEINLIDFAYTISEIDLRFFENWNSNIDKSLLLYSSISDDTNRDFFYKKNPLIFNNDYHIHYLSRLLINHLFIENMSATMSSASLEAKARLLEKWIDLGCLLDKSGNMSSWLGISSIILSQPILRLNKIWSLVSPDYIKLLKNDWSPVLFELDRRYLVNESSIDLSKSPHLNSDDARDFNSKDSYHIMAPRGLGKIYPKERVIPYFGDLVINNSGIEKCVDIYESEAIWKRINFSFHRWNDYLANLTNHDDIIKYNDDVIRRYDSMGFMFSNESLNQVLYLGSNTDERKMEGSRPPIRHRTSNTDLKNKLLRLIELNCDSMNLEKIMKLSISLEPELPEGYLNISNSISVIPSTPLELSFLRTSGNRSSVSINSVDSAQIGGESGHRAEFNPSARLPTFNNQFFKIELSKYDELTNSDDKIVTQPLDPSINKHNFVVDSGLTFRIDDFISEVDDYSSHPLLAGANGVGGSEDFVAGDDDDDVPGLGIDVDDILNSDKFTNFLLSPKNNNNNNNNTSNSNANNKSDLSVDGIKKIYKFIPKYATVDKLIDLLLLDSRYFHRDVHLDLTEYRFVFLLNYNSFMTTKDLLEKLAHRFVNSGNAVISVMKKNYLLKKYNGDLDKGARSEPNFNKGGPELPINFPNWDLDTAVDLSELGEVDYELLLKIQINILKVLIVLINNFYSNFSLDLANKSILIKLLKLFSNEILQWYNSNKIDNSLERSFESLVTYYKKLKKLFVKKTYRPVEVLKFDEYLLNEFRFNNSLHEVPMNRNLPSHRNVHKIEKFLYKFNKLLAVFYKGIKAEDWVKVYKILENSFEKNALFDFSLQKPSTPDEQIIVSNIFNFFESLVMPDDRQLLLKTFPLVFRKLFKVYFKFKSYLLVQLTDINITAEERLDRMKTLLIMAKVSKLKMSDNQFVFEGEGNIPSCIETAIINVVYSPESRLYSSLWIRAAQALYRHHQDGSNFDDIDLLLPPNITMHDLQSSEPLLPCFGWIIENLIETDKCPSYFKNMINFNKRYLIYKLIRELSVEDFEGESGSGGVGDFTFHESREFDFLLKLDESLVNQQSYRDLTLVDRFRIFKNVIRDQHHILLIDNQKKQVRDSKANPVPVNSGYNNTPGAGNSNHIIINNNNSTSNGLNGMHNLTRKTSNTSLKRQSLSYKSNSSSRFKISGLFTKSRPFSLSGNTSVPERIVGVKELPNPETQLELVRKPAVVIPLKLMKIFPVYLMSLCFKIDSESGNSGYIFQATDDANLNDWLVHLNYANRHWFHSKNLNMKVGGNPVFGVPISFVCSREQSLVPKFLQAIFEEIEQIGIKDVGVYRISTSISELTSIKLSIDKFGKINFDDKGYDTHALTSIVKSYFRELPDALLTDEVINQFFELRQEHESGETEISKEVDLIKYQNTLTSLPIANYNTLKALIKHLNKISAYSATNKMSYSNLATVIGPALTEASNLDILINNFGFMNLVLEKLIANYHEIFNDNERAVVEEDTEPQESRPIVGFGSMMVNQAEELDEDEEDHYHEESTEDTSGVTADDGDANGIKRSSEFHDLHFTKDEKLEI